MLRSAFHRTTALRGLLLVGAGLFGSATTLCAQEGGIEVFAGETLFEHGFRASLTELYKPKNDLFAGSGRMTDPLDRSFRESRTVLGLDYGLDRRFTLTALLPYVSRELESGGQTFSASGLGDIALLGKYRLFRHEGHASGFNWAAIGGIEMPTGATDASQAGAPLPASVQVGTGAWNPFLATSATAESGRSRFDATLFYKVNTEGSRQLDRGDFFAASISAGYRFVNYRYPGPTVGAKIGLQYRHEGRGEQAGVSLVDSGSEEILLTPGLSIHPRPRFDLSLGARIPLYQDYNGQQLGRDIEYVFAFGIRF